MKITGDKITLRTPRITDIDAITKYANNRKVSKWMGPHFPYPYTRRDARRFLQDTKEKHRKKLSYRMAIYHNETKEVIGMIGLESIDTNNKRAEIGYWLAEPYWGKGIMSEALQLIIHFAFKKRKLHKLWARVYEQNPSSMKLLEKHGFLKEGIIRDDIFQYGKWQTSHRYGLLKTDLKKPSKSAKL